jgi:hypothetical protein
MVSVNTNVPGAKVMVNGEVVGTSPASIKLTNAIWASQDVKIEKEGYTPYIGSMKKEIKVGPVIGGLFAWPVLLWTYGPKPNQYFELVKAK